MSQSGRGDKGKMAKDHLRDYCTAAFRFYGRWGGRDAYIKALVADLQREKGAGIGSPTEAALIHKERIMKEHMAEIADLDAVQMVMNVCDRDIRRAVEIVYLDRPHEQLEWGDIKARVHVAELTLPASESSVYRYLKKARRIFAEERGLRCKS